ncbi:MAG: sulfatase-like hydrolase/transferase [Oscillospiraceae bacterium]
MDKACKKPNILWIMTDQQKATAMSCKGAPLGLTVNIDALAEDGIRFDNAYTPCPVCAPARAAMKTGCFPPATGVVKNWVGFSEGMSFLPHRLQKQSYCTGLIGKLHFTPPEGDYGFDKKWLSDAPYSVYADDDKHSDYIKWLREYSFNKKGIDPVKLFDEDELALDAEPRKFIMGSSFRTKEEHETAWTTDSAIKFIDEQTGEQPFFCYTSYFGPHQPYGPPAPYDKWISANDITLPSTYYEDCMQNNPVFKASCAKMQEHLKKDLTEQDYKELIAAYYGQMKMIDDSIGVLIEHLKAKGIYDDTMIIFSSDHGDYLGDYGLFFKGQMYDSCAKVPLIIKPSGGASANLRGTVRNEIVNTIDLYATILNATGDFDWQTDKTQSRDLQPLLANAKAEWDNCTYAIIGATKETAQCMLRQDEYKLIRQAQGAESAVYELYNLSENKEETIDLYENADYCKVRDTLKKKLDAWYQTQSSLYPEKTVDVRKK